MRRQKLYAHWWFKQGMKTVKATCEPSTEEKLVVVALDATAKALDKPANPNAGVVQPYPKGRY